MISVIKKMGNSNLAVFAAFILIYTVLTFSFIRFFYTDSLFYQALKDQIAMDRISQMIATRKKWEWVGYFSFTLILLIKIAFTAACLFIVAYLSDIGLKWRHAYQIALVSEIVFVVAGMVKLIYFLVYPPRSIDEISNFAPLSLASLVNRHIPSYLQYMCQTLNVFELCYCLVLAKGLQRHISGSYGHSVALVAKSYGIGLFVWIIAVTFLLLQVS